jgi:hypothetical protein
VLRKYDHNPSQDIYGNGAKACTRLISERLMISDERERERELFLCKLQLFFFCKFYTCAATNV